MEKRDIISRIAQSDEDRILLARVADRIEESNGRNRFAHTRFLSPGHQAMAVALLGHYGNPRHFFTGGYAGAQRRMLVLSPEYLADLDDAALEAQLEEDDALPFTCIRVRFPAQDAPTHRDFLGSLMGAGIQRETVGDILVGEDSCDIVVLREVLPFLTGSLETVGRSKVWVSQISPDQIVVSEEKTTTIRDTVASLRLDSVVSSGFSLSREKAAEAVRSGKVAVGSVPCIKADRLLQEGDSVSLRGLGKMVLEEVGSQSKKGRTFISIRKFG